MGHLPPLITDLALILITAAVVMLIFKKIKQPLVLGYIIAGFLVGPYSTMLLADFLSASTLQQFLPNINITELIPSVTDNANIKTLAEIGVIFLLFSLGLEFSFKKLMRVGGFASITAIVEIVFITVAGFLLGKALGWSTMNCLFLGGMLASSSTTIIIRAFDELGVKSKPYAKIVFGVLVVEDIVVILLMVLLSTIAVTQQVEGIEMVMTILKLGFFLILWFVLGIFLIPTILKKAKNFLDDEVYLILSIGLCLGMVVLATQVGFSAELGAFIMGSILAETTSAEKIEHIFKPVKDLFGAIFFVSVGMMINPFTLVEYGWIVLAVTLLTIFGKFISTTIGAVLSGQPLKQSVQVGMSMAQIGEFAFIVATLGMSLGVISEFLFPVAVAASAITTFTTPYMIKYSDKMYGVIEKILPKKILMRINRYSATTQTLQAETEWKKLVKQYTTIVLMNGFIVLALMILGSQILLPTFTKAIPGAWANILTVVIVLTISAPFLWALMFKRPNYMTKLELWQNTEYNHGPLLLMEIFRIVLGVILVGYIFDRAFSTLVAALIAVPLVLILMFVLSKNIQRLYQLIESRFVTNLNSREIAEAKKNATLNSIKEKIDPNLESSYLSSWDVHLVDMLVPAHAEYIGYSLQDLPWREKYGVNVVYIKRDEKIYFSPGPDSKILPNDHLGIFTTDEQLEAFQPVFNKELSDANCIETDIDDIVVDRIVIDEHSNLVNVAIKDSAIRERTGGLVVGIERGKDKILSPSADIVILEHDIVWIVGEKLKLKVLKK